MKKRKSVTLIVLSVALILVCTTGFAGGKKEAEPPEEVVVHVKEGKFNEAPILSDLVAKGELRPVDERLPKDPLVVEPIEGIGKYGGTLHVLAANPNPWQDLAESTERAGFLLRILPGGKVVGNLAEGYELSADKKSLTLYLREGVKWSDGQPFTVDDIIFTFEDMHWNEHVESWNMHPDIVGVSKIDDYTMRFESDGSLAMFPLKLATWVGGSWICFHPKHYLQKWHIKYNPNADELAKEEGFETWGEVFLSHSAYSMPQRDFELPSLDPFLLKEFTTNIKVHERNPYYWAVDTAGNQLPYIDKIVQTIVDAEVYQMKIISGEADIAGSMTSFDNFSLYKENEEQAGYRTVLIPGPSGADIALAANFNYPDPDLRKVYRDVRFRQALSLAINRQEINESLFFGKAVPRQATVIPKSSFYQQKWAEAFAEYNPEEANRLLDAIGLTARDKDGFRIGPDGKTMFLLVEYPDRIPTAPLELIKEYWEAAGIKVMLKVEAGPFFEERVSAIDHVVLAGSIGGEGEEVTNISDNGGVWNPLQSGGADFGYCVDWFFWNYAQQEIEAGNATLEDFEGGKLPGEEPPAEIYQLKEWWDQINQSEFGSKEYIELCQKVYDFHAQNLFVIGVIGMVPHVYIAKKSIGNVPQEYGPGMSWPIALNVYANQLFFRE